MQFPVIFNISDVLDVIDGLDDFVVVEKDGYTVIDYVLMTPETFPDIASINAFGHIEWDHDALIRRECRGLIFDNASGDIIRRPYHKFFNYGERKETQRINLNQPHVILEKYDGSMIAPFILKGELHWGTKMGVTDVAKQVYPHINSFYRDFVKLCINQYKCTPIFEWCSNKQRIVLNNEKDRLILTGIRHMHTGVYFEYGDMLDMAAPYMIPVAEWLDTDADDQELAEYVHGLEGTEGFVIAFEDGYRVKMKSHWYVQLHKAKEAIQQDRNIVELIIEGRLDDVKANLGEDEKLHEFESKITKNIIDISRNISNFVLKARQDDVSRKDFAVNWTSDLDRYTKSVCFSIWENPTYANALDTVKNVVMNNLSKNVKYEELRNSWFKGVNYNE